MEKIASELHPLAQTPKFSEQCYPSSKKIVMVSRYSITKFKLQIFPHLAYSVVEILLNKDITNNCNVCKGFSGT
jgi:hypothetical protein